PTRDSNCNSVENPPPTAACSYSTAARPDCGTPHLAESENDSDPRLGADAHVVVPYPNQSSGPDLPVATPVRQIRTHPASRSPSRSDNGPAARPTAQLPADVPGSSVRSRSASGSPARPAPIPVRPPDLLHPAFLPAPPPAR